MKHKIQIRKNVFETNSSSLHTMVLSDSQKRTTKEELIDYLVDNNIDYTKDFEFPITTGEFGHEYAILDTFVEKLSYLVASERDKYMEEILSIVREYFPNCTNLFIEMKMYVSTKRELKRHIRDQFYDLDTKNNVYLYNESYGGYESFGEVDHQSSDNVANFIDAYKKMMPKASEIDIIREFLCNNKIVVITDSDSCCTLDEALLEGNIAIGSNNILYVLNTTYDWDNHTQDSAFMDVNEYIDNEKKARE